MSMPSYFYRGESQRHWIWRWLAIMGLTMSALLALISCTGKPADKVENSTFISYAGAAGWLSGLEPTEAQEQLRDWARTGLAAKLELDTARFRDAAYDTVAVRDSAFADLSRQFSGPGRTLFDGRGVLHVLVPGDDPHESRTIGLLLDQYRSDAGSDPQQVQVHHYQIRPGAQTIELTAEKLAPTREVRSAHGFVTMRVDVAKGLTDFLAQTRHLSWLEVRGSQIWAGGWNWPDVPEMPLDFEDISVIQRGYLQPSEPRPEFSLDPGPSETKDDIVAALPGLRPGIAARLISHDWKGSSFHSADELAAVVDGVLFQNNPPPAALAEMGLPSDRTQLWVLAGLLEGRSSYVQARYGGRLEGTKVGMTMFYIDKVTKDWVAGIGVGVPTKVVEGFPNPEAPIPWSHCDGADAPKFEYGRLWFGQNESGFAFEGNRVNMGAHVTRLFAQSEGDGGTEVEQSFQFGRGLRWWDQHYQAVADYEPQYQRFDQIMRWSGALDWLVSKTQAKLPQLDDAAIRSDLRFKDWYAQHDDLRERARIDFVTPPSATQEAIRPKPSTISKDCGLLVISGGVSLGDLSRRKGNRSFHPDLPGPIRRGGLFDEASSFNPATGSGLIKQVSIDGGGHVIDSLQHTFSLTADARAVVDVVANGRRVASFGNLKVWRAETATRHLRVEITAGHGQVSQHVEFQGQELGELVARKDIDMVTIQWRPGLLDRARRALESIQNRLVSQPDTALPLAADGVLYSYQDVRGRILYKIGGPDAPWLSITNELRPPGDELVFRLGAPHPQTGEPEFFLASLSPHPELPPGGGVTPRWIDVTPASADHSARIVPSGPPGGDARTVQVATPDGRTTTVSQSGDHVWARDDDPILGHNGTAEGAALLRDFPRVDEAMRIAAHTKHRLFRGVRLDEDGVALVGTDGVILVAADHPWADQVLRAIGPGPSQRLPLIRIESGRAVPE